MDRPDFSEIKSYEEFLTYYWYREELSAICKGLGLASDGTKQELNGVIKNYFEGKAIKPEEIKFRSSRKGVDLSSINMDSRLLDIGFSLNSLFRQYFAKAFGKKDFKFTADMATAWRTVKREKLKDFTIKDMMDVYSGKNKLYKYDSSACQWNQFLKDFCNDSKTQMFCDRLKAASIPGIF